MSVDSPNPEGLDRWAFEPRRIEKPWGWELIWAYADAYVGKILFVRARHSLSLQFYREKDESWYVESGRTQLELRDAGDAVLNTKIITAGACFRFRPGTMHRVTALEDTTILEVSTPQLDDVVRLEDAYRRAGTNAGAEKLALAWAAGLFEGRGLISVHRIRHRPKRKPEWVGCYPLGELKMTDRDRVVRFAETVGRGVVRPVRTPSHGGAPVWRWRAHGSDALAAIGLLRPWLGPGMLADAARVQEIVAASQLRSANHGARAKLPPMNQNRSAPTAAN